MQDDARPETATSMGSYPAFFTSTPDILGTIARMRAQRPSEESEDDEDESGSGVGMMKVIVKVVGVPEDLELSVSQEASVLDLKRHITEKLAVLQNNNCMTVDRQRLIFSGRLLTNNDDFLVDDVKMMVDCPNYVHLAPMPRGVEPSQRRRNENAALISEEGRPPLARGRASRHLSSRELRRAEASPYGMLRAAGSRPSGHFERSRQTLSEVEEDLPQPHTGSFPLLDGTRPLPTSSASAFPSVQALLCQESPVFFSARAPMGLADAIALSFDPAAALPVGRAVSGPLSMHLATSMGLSRQDLAEAAEEDAWMRANDMLLRCRVLPQHLSRFLAFRSTPTTPLQELEYQADLEDIAASAERVAQNGLELASSLRQVVYTRQQTASQAPSVYARQQASAAQAPSLGGSASRGPFFSHLYPDGYFS